MKIRVKLFATFQKGRFVSEERECPSGAQVRDIIAGLQIPAESLGIVMINHRHVQLERELMDGDTLAIFPLLGGG